jgi:hypothetical protein
LVPTLAALTDKGLLLKVAGERYYLTESGETAALDSLGP